MLRISRSRTTTNGFRILYAVKTDDVPVHAKPQKFSTLESAFLKARTHEFTSGKLRASEGSLYNLPVCLVHYPERIKKFIMEHGEKAMEELFKPEHFKTVATSSYIFPFYYEPTRN